MKSKLFIKIQTWVPHQVWFPVHLRYISFLRKPFLNQIQSRWPSSVAIVCPSTPLVHQFSLRSTLRIDCPLLLHPASALMFSRGHLKFKIIYLNTDLGPPPSMLPGTSPGHQLPQETNFTPKTNQHTSIQSRGPHRLPLCVPVHLRYIPSPRKPFIGPLGKSGLAHPRVHPMPPGTPLPVHGYMSGQYALSFRTVPYISES